jgi:hypothetical protein
MIKKKFGEKARKELMGKGGAKQFGTEGTSRDD